MVSPETIPFLLTLKYWTIYICQKSRQLLMKYGYYIPLYHFMGYCIYILKYFLRYIFQYTALPWQHRDMISCHIRHISHARPKTSSVLTAATTSLLSDGCCKLLN